MPTTQKLLHAIDKVSGGLSKSCPVCINTKKGVNLAGQKAVHDVLTDLVYVLFPGCHGDAPLNETDMVAHIRAKLSAAMGTLREQVKRAFAYQCTVDRCKDCGDCGKRADAAVLKLVAGLPGIKAMLQKDILAAYEGDPAAKSEMEVVQSYPGLYAVTIHRIAHLLRQADVPLIPRIMSEHAHSVTGIDIHPGAEIGPGFFIDHGTGVVIGETCTIGSNVKLYQGVTLGAISFMKDEAGRLVKGIKRHPNVEDNVVIYAGATILGGTTTIGANSEIGGNVWLTHSVPPGSRVYNQQPKPLIRQAEARHKGHGAALENLGADI